MLKYFIQAKLIIFDKQVKMEEKQRQIHLQESMAFLQDCYQCRYQKMTLSKRNLVKLRFCDSYTNRLTNYVKR